MTTWIKRWKYEIAETASADGIWALKTGGYLVRARTTNPRTGKRHDVMRALPDAKLNDAKRVRVELMTEVRERAQGSTSSRMLFAKYAASLFRRKVEAGDLASAKTRERWSGTLTHLVNEIGALYVDEIDVATLERLRDVFAGRIKEKKLSPRTANGYISILRVVFKRATKELRLRENSALEIAYFPVKLHRTYTREKPNSLTTELARKFLEKMMDLHPQHYAMTLLGFTTGLRPSSLRPLRRTGATPDVLWHENKIIVRRSNSMAQEVMESTKTGIDIELSLPNDVMAVLHWHVGVLLDPPLSDRWKKPPLWWRKKMASSELLFPARHGGMRSRSTLDKPFREVGEAIGLPFRLTPRGMRRTFKDLARTAGVTEAASKAVSGHQTEAMHEHYQTVQGDEMRAELSKISERILDPSRVGRRVGAT